MKPVDPSHEKKTPISSLPRLVLFVRYPKAGECKTRLIPAVGAVQAANIQRRLAEQIFGKLVMTGCPVTVAYTGETERAFTNWLGSAATLEQQADGDLSSRLLAFTEDAPAIFFGSDTPDLSLEHVHAAIAGLATHSVVIGPAFDGGYYLIGMRKPMPQLFTDMQWSTDQVLPETLVRLEKMGVEPLLLEPLSDCDTPEDLKLWPWLLNEMGLEKPS
ncbi:MAG: TIGR04282 family arsenosugar biosynthesis glycosyltransferase [Erythrobacter sp.]